MQGYRLVLELTLTVADDGTTETFYYTDVGFRTAATDTPATTYVEERLVRIDSYFRELFSGARITGAIRPAFGSVVLNNADGGLDSWVDYGISGSRVVVRIGRLGNPYPGDGTMENGHATLLIGYIKTFSADFETVTVYLKDRLDKLDKPLVTETFLGTGGLEGTGVASKKKQFVSSDPGFFPPIVIDVTKQIYFVQSTGPGGLEAYFAVYEGGIEISRGTDYSSESEITGTEPSPGTCRFYFGPTYGATHEGPVYFRLGTPPVGDLRVYGLGYQATGTSWSYAALCRLAGLDDVTGSAGFVGARLVDDNSTYIEVMQASSVEHQQFFGFNRLDEFQVGLLQEPVESESVYTFTMDNCANFRRNPPEGMASPVWQVTLNAGKAWPCAVLDGATDTLKDYLTRDPWWVSFTGESAETLLANPGALSVELSTPNRDIQNTFSQTLFVTRYIALFGGRRDFMSFECLDITDDLLAIELHDTVELRIPRFGCDNGRFFRVAVIGLNPSAGKVIFGLWGGTPGTGGGISGDPGAGSGDSDPRIIQDESYGYLRAADGRVLLIAGPDDFLQTPLDEPVLTAARSLINTL